MSLKNRNKTMLGVATAGLVLVGGFGAAGVANASPLSAKAHSVVNTMTGSPAATDAETADDAVTAAKGSVAAPAKNGELNDQAEASALSRLARITETQARAAALSRVPGGAVTGSMLTEDNGAVVYQVQVKVADGSTQEVTVDAGTGAVLSTGSADAETDDDQSSSQDVPEAGDTPDAPAVTQAG